MLPLVQQLLESGALFCTVHLADGESCLLSDRELIVVGSNLGNEVLYAALGWGLRVTGFVLEPTTPTMRVLSRYEVLCHLVDAANKLIKKHAPSMYPHRARCVCQDALTVGPELH